MSFFLAQSVMPIINWALISPEIIVCLAAVVVMLVDAFGNPKQRWVTCGISLAGLVAAAAATIWLWSSGQVSADAFNRLVVLADL